MNLYSDRAQLHRSRVGQLQMTSRIHDTALSASGISGYIEPTRF